MSKLYKIISILIVTSFLVFVGCEDRTDLTAPAKPATGTADFSTFVSIGNSLTAGYQSGALFKSAQMYSFGNLISQQVGTEYVQPLLTDPGVGGRIEIKSLSPFSTVTDTKVGQLENASYPKPYNNLGIPGALLVDILQAKDGASSISGNNAFFDIILRGKGTVLEQALSLKPTFITLWIGNNDILGYATSGGTLPHTPVAVFPQLYGQLAGAIAQTGAKVVAANIPNVAAIPFFTTVGPQLAAAAPWALIGAGQAQLRQLGLPLNPNGVIFYESASGSNFGVFPATVGFADSAAIRNLKILFTLVSSTAQPFLGDTTGAYYQSIGVTPPAGYDVSTPFGFSPLNPLPNSFVLDQAEIAEVNSVTASFNQTIADAVNANGWAFFDTFSFFNQVAQNGITVNGVKYTTEYVNGGLFSLDGVHLTNQGYGIVANKFIKAINSKFNAKIPMINVTTLPGSLVLAKQVTFGKYGLPIFPPHTFDNLLF